MSHSSSCSCSRRNFFRSSTGIAVALASGAALPVKGAIQSGISPTQTSPYPTPYPQILIIPNLESWLNNHPIVRDAIIWETTNGGLKKYSAWTAASKANLQDAFAIAYAEQATSLPEIMPNVYPGYKPTTTTVTATLAWQYFLAHVAQSLAVELRKDVPWSVNNMGATELAILFDSRQFFDTDAAHGGYTINTSVAGNVSLAPPDLVWAFLKANYIPQSSGRFSSTIFRTTSSLRLETIGNLLQWCGDRMQHFAGGGEADNMYAHWQYYGPPPVARVIKGTVNAELSPLLSHYTAGCHGTVGFLRAVGRVMNIAVEYQYMQGHAQPWFVADNRWLSHGDDPYNGLTSPTASIVGNSLSYPIEEILLTQSMYDAWFSPNLPAGVRYENVGRRPVELAYKHLPYGLCHAYIFDLWYGKSYVEGDVFESLGQFYSLPQLLGYDLWGKMDTKIAAAGGSNALNAMMTQLSNLAHS